MVKKNSREKLQSKKRQVSALDGAVYPTHIFESRGKQL